MFCCGDRCQIHFPTGGILGIISKNIQASKDCVWGVRSMVGLSLGLSFSTDDLFVSRDVVSPDGDSTSDSEKNRSFFQIFAEHGNPLHFMMEGQEVEDVEGAEKSVSRDSYNSGGNGHMNDFMRILFDDDDWPESGMKKKGKDGHQHAMVVTQSALHGMHLVNVLGMC